MKKITQLLMIVLGLVLSYVIALGVNGYFVYKMADFVNFTDQESKVQLDMENVDAVDRELLIDTLLDIADGYPIILNSGYISELQQIFYFYGDNGLILQTRIGHLTRTSDAFIDLKDKDLSIDTLNEGTYGKIYTIGNFVHSMGDLRYYSFEALKNSNISLSWSVSVIGDRDDIENYVHEVNESFDGIEVKIDNLFPGAMERIPFDWNDVFGRKILITSLFVVLMVLFVMLLIIQKQRRYISVLKLHGYVDKDIASKLYGKYLLSLIVYFIIGCLLFDVLIVGSIKSYNMLFYQIQAVLLLAIIIALAISYLMITSYLRKLHVSTHLKLKEIGFSLFHIALVAKFFLIVLVVLTYLPLYNQTIESVISYKQLVLHSDQLSRVSYIAAFNLNVDFPQQSEFHKLLNKSFEEEERYCLESNRFSSDITWFKKRPTPPITIDIVNREFAQRFISLDIIQEENIRMPIIIIPVHLSKDGQTIQFLSNQLRQTIEQISHEEEYTEDFVHYVEIVPSYYASAYVLENNFKHKIIIVYDDYFANTYFNACFLMEDDPGSTEKIEGVLERTGTPDSFFYKSQKDLVDSRKLYFEKIIPPFLFESIITFILVLMFYLILFAVYFDTHRKVIATKKMLGYYQWEVLKEFYIYNGIVYGMIVLFFVISKSTVSGFLGFIALNIVFDFVGTSLLMISKSKNFKRWIS
jgi:hypothetical protein